MVVKAKFEIPYEAFPDNTQLRKPEALTFGTARPIKIIKHEIRVSVRYLVEHEDGTRRWAHEAVKRGRGGVDVLARVKDDDDENEDDEDDDEDPAGEWREAQP